MTIPVTITGNTTADAELRFTKDGTPMATFTVAVNERIKGDNGEWTDGDTAYYRVSAWGSLAQGAADQVKKGQRVLVTGRFKPRNYENADGAIKTSLDIRADEVGICTPRTKTNTQPAPRLSADFDAVPF